MKYEWMVVATSKTELQSVLNDLAGSGWEIFSILSDGSSISVVARIPRP